MRGVRRYRRNWAALVAVLALFLHAVTTGFAAGAMASPRALDSFGNVICSSHADGRTPASPGAPDPRHLPECCIFGCGPTGPHAMATAAPELPPLPPAASLDRTPPSYRAPAPRPRRTPVNPRAPPLAT